MVMGMVVVVWWVRKFVVLNLLSEMVVANLVAVMIGWCTSGSLIVYYVCYRVEPSDVVVFMRWVLMVWIVGSMVCSTNGMLMSAWMVGMRNGLARRLIGGWLNVRKMLSLSVTVEVLRGSISLVSRSVVSCWWLVMV